MFCLSAELTHPISLIVACAENGIIGANGAMPWRLSNDLRRFKALTMGKPVIMGRKTYESIGKPLLGRALIVMTKDPHFIADGIDVVPSIEAALTRADEKASAMNANEIMVAGGGQIYAETLPLAARLYLTLVNAAPQGDTSFVYQPAHWKLMREEHLPPDERNSAATTFSVLERKII